MDRTDGSFINKNKKLEIFEIKVRYKLYDTWMMEVSKLKAIVAKMKAEGAVNAHYYTIYGNTLYDYRVRDIVKFCKENPQAIDEKWCPMTTEGNQSKILKKCINLPHHICNIIEL